VLNLPSKTTLEQGMRAVLAELASAAAETGVRAMDYCMLGRDEPALPRLLDLTLAIFKPREGKDGKRNPDRECWPCLHWGPFLS
jgi:hypothetical protein